MKIFPLERALGNTQLFIYAVLSDKYFTMFIMVLNKLSFENLHSSVIIRRHYLVENLLWQWIQNSESFLALWKS